MHIAVLAPYARPHEDLESEGSGMNQYIRESSCSLAEAGHEVTIYIRKSRAGDTDFSYQENVHIRFISAGPAERLGRTAVYEHLQNEIDTFPIPASVDLVIAHYWVSVPWIRQATAHYHGRIIYCPHSSGFNPDRASVSSQALLAETSVVPYVTWCANTEREHEIMSTIIPEDRLLMTYPGIHIPPKVSTEYPTQTDKKEILFVGRKNHVKGFDLFCKAATQMTDLRFTAIGRAEEADNHANAVNNVDHLPLADTYKAIQRADIIVHPSRYEHFGFVPLIAVAMGKSVIATDRGVVSDLLSIDGARIRTVEPDATAIVKAIVAALEDGTTDTQPNSALLETYNWSDWSARVLETTQTPMGAYNGKYAKVTVVPKPSDDGIVWFETVEMPGSVHVIPVNAAGDFGFVEELRVNSGKHTTRVLSGAIDVDENHYDAARRELEEETGLIAERLELLAAYVTGGTINDAKYYYLAHNCQAAGMTKQEKGEKITGMTYLHKGEIRDRLQRGGFGGPATTLALLKLCGIFSQDS